MQPSEIARLRQYLCSMFDNNRIQVRTPRKPGQPVEVYVGDNFVGVMHRDEDEGEVSYALQIAILEEDLPEA